MSLYAAYMRNAKVPVSSPEFLPLQSTHVLTLHRLDHDEEDVSRPIK